MRSRADIFKIGFLLFEVCVFTFIAMIYAEMNTPEYGISNYFVLYDPTEPAGVEKQKEIPAIKSLDLEISGRMIRFSHSPELAGSRVKIEVFSLDGRRLAVQIVKLEKTSSQLHLPPVIASGTYLIRAGVGRDMSVIKKVVLIE